jgi:hypothetical protein
MTLISKTAISLFISVMSIFILTPPPAPTADDLAPAPITVWQGLEPASPTPPTTVVTTPITQPDACQTVFDMARHVGWPEHELHNWSRLPTVKAVATLTRLTPKTQTAVQPGLCRSTTFGANLRRITPTAICRHTACYAPATTCLT